MQNLYKKIRRIQILSTQLATDVLAGAYRSAFKGLGMEFEDVREYQPGDDIRSIDWNVTARMSHPYIKKFREERELTVILVVDVSASLHFGSRDQLKSEVIAEIGAALAFSAIKNHDKVGLILFSEIIEKYVPPGKGVRHVLRIIRELLAFKPKQNGSNLKGALAFLGSVQRKAGICFVLSDFLCSDYAHEAALIARKHDLISICLTDPYEGTFPKIPLVSLTDLETQETGLLDTSSDQIQNQYTEKALLRIKKNKQLMHRLNAGFIEVHTDKSYMLALRKFFKLRERGRR
jgi:uncharacterized protein (DUF58 family)